MPAPFDISTARDRFPALKAKQVFFDNAGGSQTLGDVITSISDYLMNNNVQLGASYNIGKESSEHYLRGCRAGARYINCDPEEIVIGPSTTQLFRNLSIALKFSPGDEIICSKLDHEANIASWVAIAERENLALKWWSADPSPNPRLDPAVLKNLMSPKTKLVACTHASNILGTIVDIKTIARTVHEVPGALLCVDGVSFAPHRHIDVRELEADFYAFSWYKTYGPHIAMLYGRKAAQEHLRSLGHYFNPAGTLEHKLGLAAANYELTQSIPAVVDYLGGADPAPAFDAIAAHEAKLSAILLRYLRARGDVTVFGEPGPDPDKRFPTISFVVRGRGSRGVVEGVERVSEFGFRWGHFYSKRLCDEILQVGEEGVVRVSMVHYNTEDEVLEFVKVLDKVLSS